MATIQDLYSNVPSWQMSPVWNTLFGAAPATATPAPGTAAGPHTGQGAFGLVPGATALPDPFADLSKQYPNLGATNAQISGNIMSKLRGELPADVQNYIQNVAAQYGVASGMPGSGLMANRTARDLGLTSLDLTKQGAAEYASAIPTISRTQTVAPETQIALAQANAALAAAPDPALAGITSLSIYDRYLQSMANRSPAGGTMAPPRTSTGSTYPGTAPDATAPTPSPIPTPSGLSQEDLDWMWYEGGAGLPTGRSNYFADVGNPAAGTYAPTDTQFDRWGAEVGMTGPQAQDYYYNYDLYYPEEEY